MADYAFGSNPPALVQLPAIDAAQIDVCHEHTIFARHFLEKRHRLFAGRNDGRLEARVSEGAFDHGLDWLDILYHKDEWNFPVQPPGSIEQRTSF